MYLLNDVAQAIGLHHDTLGQYIRKGYVKAQKVGRQWFIDETEYRRLVKKYNEKKQPIEAKQE